MKLLATCAIVTATATLAQAQTVTVFQTGFEPAEGYVTGNLNGQNGWFAFLGEDPNFGRVTNVNPLSGSQSILLDGQDVQLGFIGNFAGVLRLTPVAATLGDVPLRYIEVTGRCAILDPTISPSHLSNSWLAQNRDMSFLGGAGGLVTAVGTGSWFGQHMYGWPISGGPNPMVPVTPSAPFNLRHLVDYQTGFASAWKDGQVAFQNFIDAFDPTFITNEFWFQLVSANNLPFDTKVWYDDIHIKAIYGCVADTNQDAIINIDDLLTVIAAWGPCNKPLCAGDITANGFVDIDDLLSVISGWGSCN